MLSRPPPSAGAQPFPLRITAWRLLPPAMTRRLVGDHGSIGNRAPSAQIHGENINCELHHRHTDFSSWPVRLHISPPSLLSPHSPPGTSRHRHPPSVLSIPFCVSACFPTVLSAVLPFLHRPFDTSHNELQPRQESGRCDHGRHGPRRLRHDGHAQAAAQPRSAIAEPPPLARRLHQNRRRRTTDALERASRDDCMTIPRPGSTATPTFAPQSASASRPLHERHTTHDSSRLRIT